MLDRDDWFALWKCWALWAAAIGVGIVLFTAKAARTAEYERTVLTVSDPSHAADEKQVRRDCAYDALRLCKEAILTRNRSVVIACMVANRDKLRPRCAAHIY